MKKTKFLPWLPTLFWMAFIFFLSQRQTTGISGTRTQRFFFFKTLHLIEYAILFLLSLFSFTKTKISKKPLVSAFSLSLIYAFSDELHQYLVPGRTARFSDISIDLFGILIGLGFYFLIIRKTKQKDLNQN